MSLGIYASSGGASSSSSSSSSMAAPARRDPLRSALTWPRFVSDEHREIDHVLDHPRTNKGLVHNHLQLPEIDAIMDGTMRSSLHLLANRLREDSQDKIDSMLSDAIINAKEAMNSAVEAITVLAYKLDPEFYPDFTPETFHSDSVTFEDLAIGVRGVIAGKNKVRSWLDISLHHPPQLVSNLLSSNDNATLRANMLKVSQDILDLAGRIKSTRGLLLKLESTQDRREPAPSKAEPVATASSALAVLDQDSKEPAPSKAEPVATASSALAVLTQNSKEPAPSKAEPVATATSAPAVVDQNSKEPAPSKTDFDTAEAADFLTGLGQDSSLTFPTKKDSAARAATALAAELSRGKRTKKTRLPSIRSGNAEQPQKRSRVQL